MRHWMGLMAAATAGAFVAGLAGTAHAAELPAFTCSEVAPPRVYVWGAIIPARSLSRE
jgi:hypothetical protein